jgi:hypothetical protein
VQAPVSLAYSREEKWEASLLVIQGAHKRDKFLLWVGYRLRNREKPIQNALRALVHASGPVAIEALKHSDPTEPDICYVHRDDRPSASQGRSVPRPPPPRRQTVQHSSSDHSLAPGRRGFIRCVLWVLLPCPSQKSGSP